MKVIFRLLVPIAALVLPSVVIAQQDASDEVIEEVITVGSRNAAKPRTASDSPVPIDVLDAENFNATAAPSSVLLRFEVQRRIRCWYLSMANVDIVHHWCISSRLRQVTARMDLTSA
jgi:hypothetical protein